MCIRFVITPPHRLHNIKEVYKCKSPLRVIYCEYVDSRRIPYILCHSLSSGAFISLWHSDTIWLQRTGTKLVQVMVCCLKTPTHSLDQCWFIMCRDQWQQTQACFARDTSVINYQNLLENYLSWMSLKSPSGPWVNLWQLIGPNDNAGQELLFYSCSFWHYPQHCIRSSCMFEMTRIGLVWNITIYYMSYWHVMIYRSRWNLIIPQQTINCLIATIDLKMFRMKSAQWRFYALRMAWYCGNGFNYSKLSSEGTIKRQEYSDIGFDGQEVI